MQSPGYMLTPAREFRELAFSGALWKLTSFAAAGGASNL